MDTEPTGSGLADAMAANTHGSDPLGSPSRAWLVLDASRPAPCWLLVRLDQPAAVRPAEVSGGRYSGWGDTCAWVAELLGWQPALIPVGSKVWRVEGGPK